MRWPKVGARLSGVVRPGYFSFASDSGEGKGEGEMEDVDGAQSFHAL